MQVFLDHANIATTSRYLKAQRFNLHRAMTQMESARAAQTAAAQKSQPEQGGAPTPDAQASDTSAALISAARIN